MTVWSSGENGYPAAALPAAGVACDDRGVRGAAGDDAGGGVDCFPGIGGRGDFDAGVADFSPRGEVIS
jgi:hypothetical protein